MAKSWDKTLLIKIAKLHYESNQSVQQIADSEGKSRATVDRMLRESHAQGLFRLQVVTDSDESEWIRLTRALKRLFPHLTDVRIVAGSDQCFDPKTGKFHQEAVLSNVAAAGAKLLAKHLSSEAVIAVGPGELVKLTVSKIRVPVPVSGLNIVPLTGYLSPHHTEVSCNLIGGLLESVSGGKFWWLPVVSIFESHDEATVNRLPVVCDTMRVMQSTNVVITSIGPINRSYVKNFIATRTFLGRQRILDYVMQVRETRPAGVIGAWLFDKEGKPVETLLSHIGFNLQNMNNLVINEAGKVIVVVGAAEKRRVEATFAALRGKLFNALVTDHCTARAILDCAEKGSK